MASAMSRGLKRGHRMENKLEICVKLIRFRAIYLVYVMNVQRMVLVTNPTDLYLFTHLLKHLLSPK